MKTLQATSAYGRKYYSNEQVVEAWKAGKDFKILGGPYFSSRDSQVLKNDGYGVISILYFDGSNYDSAEVVI